MTEAHTTPHHPEELNRAESASSDTQPRTFITVLRVVLPLAVLGGAALLAVWLIETEPQAKRRPVERRAALVEVMDVDFRPERAVVEAMGTVQAARQVVIHPRVRGEIIKLSPNLVPGAAFQKGQALLHIDPSDYKLAVRQGRAAVVRAESDLKVEQGSQSIARKEYEMLAEVVDDADRELVLRKPQLDQAQAALESARAALDRARLDLKRTLIEAPFNAVVAARHVDVGTRVTESTALVALVGTDAFWVIVSVPVDQLKWITIPDGKGAVGSAARVYDKAAWGADVFREGNVFRLAAELESKGRLAQLLVTVDDPYSLNSEDSDNPKLLIGSYVRVEIEGVDLPSMAAIDRRYVRDGNKVWIMDSDGKLDIRVVDISFERADSVFISSGLAPGEKLVKTDLSAPVKGMPLRTAENEKSPTNGRKP